MDGFVVVANVLFLFTLDVLLVDDLHNGNATTCFDGLLEVGFIPEALLLLMKGKVQGALSLLFHW